MNLLVVDPDPADPARLERELTRTADRLRTLSLVRLGAALPDGGTRAGAAFALAQELTDRAEGLLDRPIRGLPELPDGAAGDVLAVCGLDLVEAVRDHRRGNPRRDGTGSGRLGADACRWAVGALIDLRRRL